MGGAVALAARGLCSTARAGVSASARFGEPVFIGELAVGAWTAIAIAGRFFVVRNLAPAKGSSGGWTVHEGVCPHAGAGSRR